MKLQTKNRFKQFFLIIIGIAVVFIALNYLPVKPIDQHPFFNNEQDAPLVIAHRAGDQIAPGNTMTAIKMSSEMGVDMIEVDLHITKDGQIVLAHDPTVDSTTDGTGYVSDYTLDEFLALDAGFHFQNTEGEYAFKGIGVYKPTLREVFDRYPDMNYMLEVKHTNPAYVHQEIGEELWAIIEEYEMHDQVMVSSFNQKIINRFDALADGQIALGTGREVVFNFTIAHKFFLRNLFQPTGDVIQLPRANKYFNFFTKEMMEGAKRLGMDVHYWTINDELTMRQMVDAGVDGIITDRPDLLIEILEEKGLR